MHIYINKIVEHMMLEFFLVGGWDFFSRERIKSGPIMTERGSENLSSAQKLSFEGGKKINFDQTIANRGTWEHDVTCRINANNLAWHCNNSLNLFLSC